MAPKRGAAKSKKTSPKKADAMAQRDEEWVSSRTGEAELNCARRTTDPTLPTQTKQQLETSPGAVEMPVDHILESPSAREHAGEPIAAPSGLDGGERLSTTVNKSTTAPSEISRVSEQCRQLIKRMEPLAEENEKLKEARNLSKKNIQSAHRERDLAESNAWDQEYQKGVLTEKLAAVSEQMRSQSEQLAAVSDQLKSASEHLERKIEQLDSVSKQKAEQDAELGQMRQAVDQLRQEKAKAAKRVNKLVEELKGYRHKAKAQFDVLVQEAKVQKENFDAVIAAIKSVLDCVDLELAAQHDGRRQRPDTIIQRCKAAWENFKAFNRNAITTVTTHVLTVVWSHYPTIDLQSIGGGFTE
ncbi:uncharacterized protein [Miscanthus floridulus]|uniref:uncharacterized protein n=1 Tax=Miscanthus floridulus TaxID=154761 RepID=UPI0034598385